MIYNLYVWTKKGKCIYYQAWNRQTTPKDSIEQEQSLMYGFLIAIKSFVDKTSPSVYVSLIEGFHALFTLANKPFGVVALQLQTDLL